MNFTLNCQKKNLDRVFIYEKPLKAHQLAEGS